MLVVERAETGFVRDVIRLTYALVDAWMDSYPSSRDR